MLYFGNLFKETSRYKHEQKRHGRTVQILQATTQCAPFYSVLYQNKYIKLYVSSFLRPKLIKNNFKKYIHLSMYWKLINVYNQNCNEQRYRMACMSGILDN